SFSYLLDFDIDSVKIDGVFIKNIFNSAANRAVVRSVVDIATTICATTVAEFVENDEIKTKLTDLGVDFVQGFGVHKPEPLVARLS
ncbi:MAG: EAL domain-containing protein, partial [Kangiellaceae bacterium]|nr:EAL domain-containing protein [Kangiellaceae bacterium]